ncbi:hypothetical protein PCLA_12f0286 [Pseudomonas citronellolis]|nr:hypothetical protein PCLA_12f0286 [Pseudomonas citronellolis]
MGSSDAVRPAADNHYLSVLPFHALFSPMSYCCRSVRPAR